MIRWRALLAATGVNVATLGVLLLATELLLFASLAGGLVAGYVVGDPRDAAVTGGLAAFLAPPVGALLAVGLTAVVLLVGITFGDPTAYRGAFAAAFGVAAIGPLLGLTALLIYAASLFVLVPLGAVGGVAGALTARNLPRTI